MPEDTPAGLLTALRPADPVSVDPTSSRAAAHTARTVQAEAGRARVEQPILVTALVNYRPHDSARATPAGARTPTALQEACVRAGPGLRILPPRNHFIEAGLWDSLIAGSAITRATADALLHESAIDPPLLAILEGVVRVFMRTASGRQVTLRYARPGDLVGLPGCLSPKAHTSTEAVTDTSVAVLSLDRLRELCADHVDLAWPIAKQMTRWGSSDVDLDLLDLEHRPMTARIAGHLLESATRRTGGGSRAHISQEHLAVAAGTVREVAARSLAELRNAGIVDTRRGAVLIIDRLQLALIAHGGEVGLPPNDR